MAKLKLTVIEDDKPVRLTIELPGSVHRDLLAYAAVLAKDAGGPAPDPVKLISPMVARFMATDRVFAKRRREGEGLKQTP